MLAGSKGGGGVIEVHRGGRGDEYGIYFGISEERFESRVYAQAFGAGEFGAGGRSIRDRDRSCAGGLGDPIRMLVTDAAKADDADVEWGWHSWIVKNGLACE